MSKPIQDEDLTSIARGLLWKESRDKAIKRAAKVSLMEAFK